MRLTNAQDVEQNVTPIEGLPANVVAFQINGDVNGETSDGLFVIFNPNNQAEEIALPDGVWDVYVNGEKAGTEALSTITNGKASVDPISALVLVKGTGTMTKDEEGTEEESAETSADSAGMSDENPSDGGAKGPGTGVIAAVCAVAVLAVAGIVIVLLQRKKKSGKK